MTKTFALASVAAVLCLATACSSVPGTPSPASDATGAAGSGTPPVSSSSALAAPKVANPLKAGKFEQDPCSLLASDQVSPLVGDVRNSSNNPGNVAPICGWFGADGSGLRIGFVPGQGGLSSFYKNGQAGGGAYFEPSPDISGYPAAYGGVSDDRKKGGCQIAVGISDSEVFTASVLLWKTSPSYNDPCPLVAKAAELVVAKLKEGA